MSYAPELSVIMVVPGPYADLHDTVAHLERQTARARIELVFVVADRSRAAVPSLTGFWGLQVIEFGPIHDTGEPMAEGIRRARAKLVVPGEDHSFPEPEWAEQLIQAHAGPYAAVGALVTNGNPKRLESWASLFHFHGPHTGWTMPREMDYLPEHQTSYKRHILLTIPELGHYLNFESLLYRRLIESGHRMLLQPTARVKHIQCSSLSSLVEVHVVMARAFAAARSHTWGPGRRALYFLGSPLLPALKLARMLPDVLRSRATGGYWPRIIPYLLVTAVASAIGEAAGYSLGAGRANEAMFTLECDRRRHG